MDSPVVVNLYSLKNNFRQTDQQSNLSDSHLFV